MIFENKLIGRYVVEYAPDAMLQQYPWLRRNFWLSWQPAVAFLTDIAVDTGAMKVTSLDELEHGLRRRKW